jgi:hypothetical protein
MTRLPRTEPAVPADDRAGMDAAAGADGRALADGGERVDAGLFADDRGRVDVGPGVDAVRRRVGPAVQPADDRDEGGQRVGDADDGQAVGLERVRDDGRGGAARGQAAGVAGVLDERDVPGLGLTEGAGAADRQVAIPHDGALHQFRELPQSDTHAQPLSSVKAARTA